MMGINVRLGVGDEGKIGPFSPLSRVVGVVGKLKVLKMKSLKGKCDVPGRVLGVPDVCVISSGGHCYAVDSRRVPVTFVDLKKDGLKTFSDEDRCRVGFCEDDIVSAYEVIKMPRRSEHKKPKKKLNKKSLKKRRLTRDV